MPYSLRTASPAKTRAEAVVVGVLQGGKGGKGGKEPVLAPGAEEITAAYGRRLRGLLATLGVKGTPGEVTRVPTGDAIASPLLVLVGLGEQLTTDGVRRAAGTAARSVPNATSVALALPADTPELISAVVEGHRLGAYTFEAYRTPGEAKGATDVLVLSPIARQGEATAALTRGEILADAVSTTRDWVNIPPGDLTPPVLADAVVAAASEVPGVTVTVHDEADLAALGCGGILAVGAGSAAPPRLVELSYAPEGAATHLALVGKGITFDSGGLSIKPGSSMATMKLDMHGAATVVQATLAIARLGLPVRVSAYVPMAENMIGGASFRPGDVVRHYGGTTVEVSNTDAEGRMILADALVRAVQARPDAIIDVATLTGAMAAALGDRITGVLGSDDVVAAVLAAGEAAGEAMWPMPLPEAVTTRVRSSTIADLAQHDGVRWGGGLYAAAFLREFTGDVPWAHLDIAGTSWSSGAASGHVTPGGTGVGVTTLVTYAERLA